MKNIKVLIISIILGVALVIFCCFMQAELISASFKGTITPESYKELEEYAFELANSNDVKELKDAVVTKKLTTDALIIKVDKTLYGIKAAFPLRDYRETIDNGFIYSKAVIDYNNVKYSKNTIVKSPAYYIIIYSWVGLIFVLMFYALLIPKPKRKRFSIA